MPEQLEFIEEGNTKATTMLVFLQGWPDNAAIWDRIGWKQDLNNNHILFINLPNTNGKITHPWGKDFPELIEDIKFTIDGVAADKKKVLVAHDWGCFYGYMFDDKYPKYFSQLIVMDVPAIVQLTRVSQILYVICYQMFLTVAFLVGGKIGKFMTQKMASLFMHNPPYYAAISSAQNYPYYYMWKNKILSGLRLKKPFLKGYRPSSPTVYLYGKKKPFQFHGSKWVSLFEGESKRENWEMHGLEDGHWFMKKYSKFITDLISRRLRL